MNSYHFKLSFLFIFLLNSACYSSCRKLLNNNVENLAEDDLSVGYDIVVGIEQESPPFTNMSQFVDNLSESINGLSKAMFKATKGLFHVKSAQIIIPRTWNIIDIDFGPPTYFSSNNAHIRLSSKVERPRAENPNLCGFPGNFIELPVSFFRENMGFDYGDKSKALLNLWSRYRWGIWEEHGYQYSTRFPYSNKKLDEEIWRPTGCSNEAINGVYLNSTGDICEDGGEYPPDPDCIFIPDENTNATSSLLHFHWLETIAEFCDETTHKKEEPNKQNAFCSHKSALEVIRESPDYLLGVKTNIKLKSENVPEVSISLHKTSQLPLFYLLLDGGKNTIPEFAMKELRKNLTQLYKDINQDVIASVGIFNDDNGNTILEESIPWTSISSNLQNFTELVENYSPKGPTTRNFAKGLEIAINKLKKIDHPSGSLILVVKSGAASNIFNSVPYEQDLNAILLEHNIRFYAIELSNSPVRKNINLLSLCKNEGSHLSISGAESLRALTNKMTIIKRVLNRGFTKPYHRYILTSLLNPGQVNNIQVMIPGIYDLYISLTLPLNVAEENVTLNFGNSNPFEIESRFEWDEENDATRRKVLSGKITVENIGKEIENLRVEFECQNSEISDECKGHLTLYGSLSDDKLELDNLKIAISTTAYENTIDLSKKTDLPFAIHAKVKDSTNRPIIGLKNIDATVYHQESSTFYKVPLNDNGDGSPDTFKEDGIYSTVFSPPSDGLYSIWITFSETKSSTQKIIDESSVTNEIISAEESRAINVNGRLLPVDQNIICLTTQCSGIRLNSNFQRVFKLPDTIRVLNSSSSENKVVPAKIYDLSGWAKDNFEIELKWTSPILFNGGEGVVKTSVENYTLKIGTTVDEILNGGGEENVIDFDPSAPGTIDTYIFKNEDTEKNYYFAIISTFNNIKSEFSNIIHVKSVEFELITTPFLPPQITTEPSTTVETVTDPPRVTRPPVISTSSTEESNNEEEEEKYEYWYQKPSGYITLIAFGVAVLLLIAGVFLCRCIQIRGLKRQGMLLNDYS